MAIVSLISRVAHSPCTHQLAILQAQLKSSEPLDFALSTPSGSLLGLVMRLLRVSSVGGMTVSYGESQLISSADFKCLRSSLLRKLESFVPGPEADMSNTLNLWLGQQTGVLHSTVQPLIDDVIAALLAKGADPLAPDAEGKNTLFHLARSGDYAQLLKLLRAEAPWKACGVEGGGGRGDDASHSDLNKTLHLTLHLLLAQRTDAAHGVVQPLIDGVIKVLLAEGADPLATDADGNNALFHLVKSGDYAQLIKLLRAEAPWQACGVESGGVKGAAASYSDINKTLHLLLGQQMRALNPSAQSLMDDVIAALLAKGADPLAPDAEGSNALLLLARSDDHSRLIKLLSGRAPWKPCGIETAVFHRNADGQTARALMEARHPPANRTADVRVVLELLQELETIWTHNIKPTLIHTLSHECGMAKDAAILCAQYIDGSSSGGSGKAAGAGEESKEAGAAAQ